MRKGSEVDINRVFMGSMKIQSNQRKGNVLEGSGKSIPADRLGQPPNCLPFMAWIMPTNRALSCFFQSFVVQLNTLSSPTSLLIFILPEQQTCLSDGPHRMTLESKSMQFSDNIVLCSLIMSADELSPIVHHFSPLFDSLFFPFIFLVVGAHSFIISSTNMLLGFYSALCSRLDIKNMEICKTVFTLKQLLYQRKEQRSQTCNSNSFMPVVCCNLLPISEEGHLHRTLNRTSR